MSADRHPDRHQSRLPGTAHQEAGCRLLIVGYESGDPQILKNIKKGATVERARQFTKDCHKLGLVVHGDFILGLPGETRETIRTTRQAMEGAGCLPDGSPRLRTMEFGRFDSAPEQEQGRRDRPHVRKFRRETNINPLVGTFSNDPAPRRPSSATACAAASPAG